MSDLYRELILQHLREPLNTGETPNADAITRERNSSCGDEITVFVKLDKNQKKIEHLTWTGNGCAISQAAMSVLSQKLQGQLIADVKSLEKQDIEQLLGIEEISSGRIKCLLLGLRAVQRSL